MLNLPLGLGTPIDPTGELDFQTGVQILELLQEQAEKRTTIVVVTHNRTIARISDRVVELQSGAVASDGPPPRGKVAVTKLEW